MPAEAVSRDAAAPRAEPAGARPADIAVIGMAGQFPDAPDVDAFRALLEHARDGAPGVSGGMLENRDRFDHAFFHITPDEADAMHPYQRLVLQESWKALEDAGYNPAALAGARVGVFVGAEPADYRSTTFSGSSDALIASRVSYHLNLRGPAYVVNTGCSSGAVAIHLACESLRRNESDVVLACGIFAAMGPRMLGALGQAGMLSAGGRCRSFDAGADGTAFAEGIGVVALKRLADAIADGDPIHGIVKASGVNQDGTSNGIMAPNGVAQEELIVDVYERFGIDPADIRYVEAHGTGTLFGDAVEANALVRAFRRFTERSAYCALGTVKATIGHTAAAAGVIGLIRILLSMRARRLPGMPGLGRANPMIDLDASAFSLGLVSREWPAGRDGRPRLAALNTFGHSGTNVHIVVQEPPQARARPARAADGPRVAVPLSAMDREALRRYAARLCERLEAEGAALCVGDVAHTLRVAREPMAQRIVLFASTTGELAALLRAFVDGRDSPCLLDGAVTAAARAAGLDAAQLAQAARWLAGKRVDWPPAGGTPMRVHLPAYPFAGRRCGAAGWARAEAGASRDCAAAGPCEPPAGVAAAAMTVAAAGPRVDATPSAAADRARGAARPAEWLAARVAARLGVPAARVDRRRSLLDLGLTSQDLVSLAGQLRDATGEALLPSVLFDYPTIERLAAHLADTCPAAFGAAEPAEPAELTETAELTATAEPAEPAETAETGRAAAGDAASSPAPGVIALLERLEGGGLSLEETIYLIENTK